MAHTRIIPHDPSCVPAPKTVYVCVFAFVCAHVCTRPAAHDSNLIKHRAAVAFNCLRRGRLTRRTWHRAREHESRGFWLVNSGMCQTAARRSPERARGSSCKRVCTSARGHALRRISRGSLTGVKAITR